ncbi:MAG TPA: Fur family transcriptional regulator [Alphaproteobacteria bacterium]|nr:Fur family transcriptional regulator [Alphaproteobacteria bacterium]
MTVAIHDHRHCIAGALSRAEAQCARAGARLTPIRRQVLELVWRSHKPRGAYDILADLETEGGRAAAPLTVYRALDFLVAQGLVHRLESLNAYIGCAQPGEGDEGGHSGQFLVCERCGNATEVDDPAIAAALDRSARAQGFRITRPTVEIRGICAGCAAAEAA